MPKNKIPPDVPGDAEARIDDQDAALEESEEQDQESTVVEDADANLKEDPLDLTDGSQGP